MSRKKHVSIKDVAAACNLSTATVSRFLNNPKKCSPETQKKVAEALERLNYHATPISTAPRNKVIGFMCADPKEQWPSMLLNAFEPKFRAAGYLPLVCHSGRDGEEEKRICQFFIDQNVSGVINISGSVDIEPMLSAVSIPVVYIDPIRDTLHSNAISVASNHYLGAYMATEHLLSLGCRRILFLGRYIAAVNNYREHGYLDALKAHGIEPESELIQDFRFQSDPDGPATRDLVIYLIKYGLKFDAIFAANDLRAYGALSALHQCGLRVPEDVKLIGFDDLSVSTYSTPPITTIRQNVDLIAARSSDILLDLIKNGDHYTERSFITPVSLVIRGTT